MSIKSVEEIKLIDEDLHLFDQDDWIFMDDLQNLGENNEYYNDVIDTDFRKNSFSLDKVLIGCIVLLAVTVLVIMIKRFMPDEDYNKMLGLQSVMQGSTVTVVNGEECSSQDIIDCAKVLDQYFGVLDAEDDYSALYNLCQSTSTFADTYYGSTSRITNAYDTNDCYARGLRRFASFCKTGKITNLVLKDGVYYCYFEFTYPNDADVHDYVNLYSYDITKYMSGGKTTDADILRWFYEITESNPVKCHTDTYELKLVKGSDGRFLIQNDSFVTSICTDAYSQTINLVSTIISTDNGLK